MQIKRLAYATSLGLFAVFGANVVAGRFFRAAFAGDVIEMLLLFAAVISFTVGILHSESESVDSKE